MDNNRAKAMREIIHRAIQRETTAFNYYRKASLRAEDPQLAAIFVQLAEEERKHHAILIEELRRVEQYVIGSPTVRTAGREARLEPLRPSERDRPFRADDDQVGDEHVRFTIPFELPYRRLPTIPEVDLAAVSLPLHMIGGDHIDTLALERPGGDALAFLLFDVVGHGLHATRLKAHAIQHFGNLRHDWLSRRGPVDLNMPAQVMRALNDSVHNDCMAENRFLTALYCVIDPTRQELRYASAGHEPPVLLRANGETIELSETDILLGIFPDSEFRELPARLLPGDVLVLFSDGISEASGQAGNMFERVRIQAAARRASSQPAAKILAAILADLRKFMDDGQLTDEASLAVMKVSSQLPG